MSDDRFLPMGSTAVPTEERDPELMPKPQRSPQKLRSLSFAYLWTVRLMRVSAAAFFVPGAVYLAISFMSPQFPGALQARVYSSVMVATGALLLALSLRLHRQSMAMIAVVGEADAN